MKVYICAICRCENKYLREWVEWHKSIGFTKIILFDNGFEDDEFPKDVLQDYIDEGFVEIVDYRDRTICQLSAYNEFWLKYGKQIDWAAFIDIDEFFVFKDQSITNISQYLSNDMFNNYDVIHVNWETYGDNGQIYETEGKMMDRFKQPTTLWINILGKMFIRGRVEDIYFNDVHFMWSKSELTCNECGEKITTNTMEHTNKICSLNHYKKSLEEYCDRIKNGVPARISKENWVLDKLAYYFQVSEKTQEKLDYIKERFGITLPF